MASNRKFRIVRIATLDAFGRRDGDVALQKQVERREPVDLPGQHRSSRNEHLAPVDAVREVVRDRCLRRRKLGQHRRL